MQRPILNPMFMDLDAPLQPRKTVVQRLMRIVAWLGDVMLTDVLFWKPSRRLCIEDGSPAGRIMRGLFYRLLFVPIVLVAVVLALVYVGTHPPRVATTMDPLSQGIYYDPVNYTSEDGVRLEGWLVPDIDAKAVIEKKEEVLRTARPAVILVHDYGANCSQMLPLVRPLHDAGYIVLVTSLRGTGGSAATGSTFGIREALDVQAAVEMMRKRVGVDPKRIAVLGIGTGANAAILAAERDARISALILDHPVINVEEMISEYLGPPQRWLGWLKPACKWTFELAYKIDADDLDLAGRRESLRARPVLMFDPKAIPLHSYQRSGMKHIQDFLAKHMANPIHTPASPQPVTAGVDQR